MPRRTKPNTKRKTQQPRYKNSRKSGRRWKRKVAALQTWREAELHRKPLAGAQEANKTLKEGKPKSRAAPL